MARINLSNSTQSNKGKHPNVCLIQKDMVFKAKQNPCPLCSLHGVAYIPAIPQILSFIRESLTRVEMRVFFLFSGEAEVHDVPGRESVSKLESP